MNTHTHKQQRRFCIYVLSLLWTSRCSSSDLRRKDKFHAQTCKIKVKTEKEQTKRNQNSKERLNERKDSTIRIIIMIEC